MQQTLVRMDWLGLNGRILKWRPRVPYDAAGRTTGDRFLRTVALPWADLRDSYFECFRRVALSFLDVFPTADSAIAWGSCTWTSSRGRPVHLP